MSQHTPGPWKIVDSWEDHTIEGPKGEEIIFQDGPYQTPSIKEANARLIAAAPEMLKALEMLVEKIKNDEWFEDWSKIATSVIDKAKGETE